jgi:predicted DNA-binding transcriptional regulator AlpA
MITTRQAAKKLGIGAKTLSNYIAVKKVPSPSVIKFGKFVVHSWTEEEIENVRKLLPKIANGRKTRYKKKQSAVSTQRSARTKAQAGVPVPHMKRKSIKKK